jgi:hypothetical protein
MDRHHRIGAARRAGPNLTALAAALHPFNPVLRGAPRELPFKLDAATLRAGLNFHAEYRGRRPRFARRRARRMRLTGDALV